MKNGVTKNTSGCLPMPDWYLQLDGEEHGPLSEADFLELIRTSIVTPETKMRTSQSSPKPTASKVKGIRFASTDVKKESILDFEKQRSGNTPGYVLPTNRLVKSSGGKGT
jgi:hypothetical protein